MGRELSLLYIGPLPPHPGGSGTLCGELLRGMADDGHQIHAVAPITADATALLPDAFAAEHPEIDVTRYRVPRFETNCPATSDSYRLAEESQLRNILEDLVPRVEPSLVFLGRDSYAFCTPELVRPFGVPSILLSHSSGLHTAMESGVYSEYWTRRFITNCKTMEQIVTPARAAQKQLGKLGLSNVVVIPTGVDVEEFAPRPKDPRLLESLGVQADDVVVSHISNLQPAKRPLDFVAAAEVALKEMPNLMFLVVGEGSGRKEMVEQCEKKGMANNFRFTGWVDHQSIPAFINLSDLVVLPSQTEVQALVWLETQACGRVIVSSDIPPALEVIEDGETGLVFRKGDPVALAASILRAARDPTLRGSIGRKAREHALSRPMRATVAEYLEVCARVTQDYRRSHEGAAMVAPG